MKLSDLGQNGMLRMGFGAMSFSDFYGPVEDAQIRAILDNLLDLGIAHIDTADVYGNGRSEREIGAFFKATPGARDQFFLATKGGISLDRSADTPFDNTPAYLARALDASLTRLGVDAVDLYYIHRRDRSVPLADVVGTLDGFRQAGKIKSFGFSEVSPTTLRAIHAQSPMAAVQSEYSLQTRLPELGVTQFCADTDTTLVAFSPVGRSLLTDDPHPRSRAETMPFLKNNPRFMEPNLSANIAVTASFRALAADLGLTAAGLAVAWTLAKGAHVLPIPGTRSVDRLRDLAQGAARRLTHAEVDKIEDLLPMGWVSGDRYSDAQWHGPERYS